MTDDEATTTCSVRPSVRPSVRRPLYLDSTDLLTPASARATLPTGTIFLGDDDDDGGGGGGRPAGNTPGRAGPVWGDAASHYRRPDDDDAGSRGGGKLGGLRASTQLLRSVHATDEWHNRATSERQANQTGPTDGHPAGPTDRRSIRRCCSP